MPFNAVPIHGHMLKTALAQLITDKCQSYMDLIQKRDYPVECDRHHVRGCAYLYAHLFSRFVAEPANVLANYKSLVDACESRHGLRYEHRDRAILIFRAMADFCQFNELYVAVKSATTVVEVPQVPIITPTEPRQPLSLSPVESYQQDVAIEQYITPQSQPSTSTSLQYNHSPDRSTSPAAKRRALSSVLS